MTTNEEFERAIGLIISCDASVKCGCEVDEELAQFLYYQCKRYVDVYRKRFVNI